MIGITNGETSIGFTHINGSKKPVLIVHKGNKTERYGIADSDEQAEAFMAKLSELLGIKEVSGNPKPVL